MQNYYLNNVSKIDSGKSFRHRIESVPNGECLVIQMKNISSDHSSIVGEPQSIRLDGISHSQLLGNGDILFMAKGNRNFATLYQSDQPAIAVSLFFIIRPDRAKVLPEYLTWFLNSSKAQGYFEQRRLGVTIGNIRKDALAQLEVELPDMKKQKQIAELNNLMRTEKYLTQEYLEKKEVFLNQTMINLIK